ncbi:DUF1349 domain-containing protein [Rufibacter immobilis]|uniref:DUF1349 domain-containing protein n=1 Tax=Rufibacter immobilis TaxID=1348778 RepID=UPI0035E54EFC
MAERLTVNAIPFPVEVLDQPLAAKVLSPNTMLLTAGKGTDLHNPASGIFQRSNAPKAVFSPDAEFEFSARVVPSHENLYDGGALLIWTDHQNWAKVLLQNTGETSVLGLSVVENSLTDDSYFQVGSARGVFLKLVKKGKVCTFYTSADGTVWTVLRQFVYHRPDNMRVGFYAKSPKGPECQVEFSNITYTRLSR